MEREGKSEFVFSSLGFSYLSCLPALRSVKPCHSPDNEMCPTFMIDCLFNLLRWVKPCHSPDNEMCPVFMISYIIC